MILLKKAYRDTVKFGMGHSLIMGNHPEFVTGEFLDEVFRNPKLDKDVEALGLFETAAPNLNTYYPNAKPEDLKPNEEDFIKPVFRMLSEVIVNPRRNPIDFAKNGVLKNSMHKLLGQTIYSNHESFVGNQVGAVSKVFWQDGYETNTGIKVPPGINGEFKIDGKAHPNIARSILMEPPSIHSNSVTVSFAWEPSHKFGSEEEFFKMLGTKDKRDGKLVRRIAFDIEAYHETSLVAHGADGFAQRVDKSGQIVNPLYGQTQHKLSAEDQKIKNNFYMSFKDKETLSLSTLEILDNNETHQDMKNIITLFNLLFATSLAVDATEEEALEVMKPKWTELTQKLANFKDVDIAALTKRATDAEALNTSTQAELAKVKPIAEKLLTDTRTEVKRLYKLLKGDKEDATMLATFDAATLETLAALQKDYAEQVELSLPATCKKCGSKEVSRMSVKPEGTESKVVKETYKERLRKQNSTWALGKKAEPKK